MSRVTDLSLLDSIVDAPDLPREYIEAFGGMRDRLLASVKGVLTKKQREWAQKIADKYAVQIDNSSVPRGREVRTPDVLRTLPLDPPGRRKFGVKHVA